MVRARIAESLPDTISASVFIDCVKKFSRQGVLIRVGETTKKRLFKIGDTRETWSALALLAKTAAVYGDDDKPQPTDAGWHRLLVLANSLDRSLDTQPTTPGERTAHILREGIRTGFEQRFLTPTDLSPLAARTYIMLHDIANDAKYSRLDVTGKFRERVGVDLRSFWTIMFALFSMATTESRTLCVTPEEFFINMDGKRRPDLESDLKVILRHISCDLDGYSSLYRDTTVTFSGQETRKYCLEPEPGPLYATEPNPLRDYPIIRTPAGKHFCPIVPWLFVRAFHGTYFDLLNAYKTGDNVGDTHRGNVFAGNMGHLFQDYIGMQLRTVVSRAHLQDEFAYEWKQQRSDSPDFIVWRDRRRPLIVECKARRPTVPLIVTGDPEAVRAELRVGISKSLGQIAEFMVRAKAGTAGLESFREAPRYRALVVVLEEFPLHWSGPVREMAVEEALKLKPHCEEELKDMVWIAASSRDMENLVSAERFGHNAIERSFDSYLRYLKTSAPLYCERQKRGRHRAEIRKGWSEFLGDKCGGQLAENELLLEALGRFHAASESKLFGTTEAGTTV